MAEFSDWVKGYFTGVGDTWREMVERGCSYCSRAPGGDHSPECDANTKSQQRESVAYLLRAHQQRIEQLELEMSALAQDNYELEMELEEANAREEFYRTSAKHKRRVAHGAVLR
jgi:hypothetical protein